MTRDKEHTFISRYRSFNVYYKPIMQHKIYWTGMIVKLKMATTKSKHLQLYLLTLTNPTPSLHQSQKDNQGNAPMTKSFHMFSTSQVK